jgi:hypothetical protein
VLIEKLGALQILLLQDQDHCAHKSIDGLYPNQHGAHFTAVITSCQSWLALNEQKDMARLFRTCMRDM